ncbi:hypothetical protein CEXT_477151, partial [Caerostris extrusa]
LRIAKNENSHPYRDMNAHSLKLKPENQNLVFFDGGHYETPSDAAEKYYSANGGGDYLNSCFFTARAAMFVSSVEITSHSPKEMLSVDGCRGLLWHEARLSFCQEMWQHGHVKT